MAGQNVPGIVVMSTFGYTVPPLAVLGALIAGITSALDDPAHRVAAIVTFLVVASGVVILNIGSAFWGLLMGGIVMAWLGRTRWERTRGE